MPNKVSAVRPRGTDSARVIQVIETRSLIGCGTPDDPARIATQYWDFDGNLLASDREVTNPCEPYEVTACLDQSQ